VALISGGNGSGSGGISANLLPWLVDIDVFATAVTNTTWNTIAIGTTEIYCGDKRNAGAQNSQIGWDVVLAAGTWDFELTHNQDSNRGIYTVAFDGSSVGTIDGYQAATTVNVRSSITGIVVAATAKKRLTLTMATKNASSSSFFGTIAHVRLQRTA